MQVAPKIGITVLTNSRVTRAERQGGQLIGGQLRYFTQPGQPHPYEGVFVSDTHFTLLSFRLVKDPFLLHTGEVGIGYAEDFLADILDVFPQKHGTVYLGFSFR